MVAVFLVSVRNLESENFVFEVPLASSSFEHKKSQVTFAGGIWDLSKSGKNKE